MRIEKLRIDYLQRKAFEYFEIHHDPQTGLVADVALPGSPSSIAATGFGISTFPIAVSRGWWSRDDAALRVVTLLRFLADCDQSGGVNSTGHQGFYFHFLDMQTGRRAWESELSTIDTAFLMCGVLTVAEFFNGSSRVEREIHELASALYNRVNWAWALDGGRCVSMGWNPESGFLPYRFHGYDEAMPLYLLGIGSDTHPLPVDSYSAWGESFLWADHQGGTFVHAGPLFIHVFTQAWLDLRGLIDPHLSERGTDYFQNTRRAIAQQIDYGRRNPRQFGGYSADLWGLTASDGPRRTASVKGKAVDFLGYIARAVPHGPDDGTIAPWASLACLPFEPEICLDALSNILQRFGDALINGRFPEALNPTLHRRRGKGRWRSNRVLGIDQGLVVMACENHRSEMIWDLTKSVKPLSRGLERAGFSGGWLVDQTLPAQAPRGNNGMRI